MPVTRDPMPKPPAAESSSSPTNPEGESVASGAAIRAARLEKKSQLEALGVDPWGSRLDGVIPIGEIRKRAGEIKFRGEDGQVRALPADRGDFRNWLAAQGAGELSGPKVRAAGRIVLQRSGGKLIFVDIRDRTGQIQILIGQRQVGEHNWLLAQCFDLGDIIGVDGELRFTKTGELTIFAEQLHFLTKALEPPPDKYKGLADAEMRQRMRYLDLLYNEGVRERFLGRARIIQSIRDTLATEGYIEVEGPTLHSIAGGAAARPFKTHHNALDMPLFLRIALELHLKRLLVGGLERVYELGRVYRNEGISTRHNPEFTMLEAYQAYGDYRTMMDLTEKIVAGAVAATGQPPQIPWGEATIDFTPPFARRTYAELFAEVTGVDPGDEGAVRKLAGEIGLDTAGKHADVIKSEVFEELVEDRLTGPIFVLDYPAALCPLTKRKPGDPAVAERFELFIQGMEIANAYTELNDPDLQEKLFKTQLAGLSEEESMAKMDRDFLRALRHGMPPAGGLGIGIDRLVMLLTNSQSIRDVILFPLLRPEAVAGPGGAETRAEVLPSDAVPGRKLKGDSERET
jgi:lysyl-tRNA synthetase class 2